MLFQPPFPFPASEARRGAILLVVITMLVLFAAVALSFVFYAQSEATASRYMREAQAPFRADVEPEQALAYFLNQLIYDVPDDESGAYSALRGHSLSRLVYGWQSGAFNTAAFNGVGRLHTVPVTYGAGATALTFPDAYNIVNYTYHKTDGFVLDPERSSTSSRANPSAAANPYVGGANVSYTYPDLNNMALAVVNADGEVLIPSYFRSWAGNIGNLGPTNTNFGSTATDAKLRYYTLRPLAGYHGSAFKTPDFDGGGDVRNLDSGKGVPVPASSPRTYYNNDSIWLDAGFPVLTAPNGTKYKVLFAPLVLDLDGRLNLNAHGNIRGNIPGGASNVHVSNQGWGPWEVNLSKVFLQDEAKYLFVGKDGVKGRYGTDNQPATAGSLVSTSTPAEPAPRMYATVDFDATQGPGPPATYTPSARWLLPGETGNSNPSYLGFPLFPATSYTSGDSYERTNHSLLYNFFTPQGDDRAFQGRELEALLRYGGTNSPALTSDLFSLCRNDFSNATSGPKARRLVTTHSFDLDRPGSTPWLGSPNTALYELITGNLYPTGPAVSSPTTGGEYGPDGRGKLARVGRLNLNRTTDTPAPAPTLRNYPTPDATTGRITDTAGFANAQRDRQELAKEIFNRLREVTTGNSPGVAFPANTSDEYKALRWLAQLAVNIVDFRDADDYITPFHWDTTDPDEPDKWVYGTELPRLVLNEAYAELDNNPADIGQPMATMPYNINFWVELHNPFQADSALPDYPTATPSVINGAARLQMPVSAPGASDSYAIYQLVIATSPLTTALNATTNVKGDVDAADVKTTVADFVPEDAPVPQPSAGVDVNLVLASAGAYSGPSGENAGFYVLGPKFDFPGTDASRPSATLRVKEQTFGGVASAMRYSVPNTTPLAGLPNHSLVLRRLACPHLPPDPNPGSPTPNPTYNPYVTVDFMGPVPTRDGVEVTPTAPRAPVPTYTGRASVGRRQPYAGHISQLVDQTPGTSTGITPFTTQPQHTFFRHNAVEAAGPPSASMAGQTLTIPFDWLTHLDRQLISPMELLHVSAFRPQELTQQFVTPAGSFTHRAPWFDQTSRLYRVLEYLGTAPRAAGVSTGGRIPGKINLNAIWDKEVFRALCDAQTANSFTNDDVDAIYTLMLSKRTPTGIPSANDQPFLSLATGNTTDGNGIKNTFLRAADGSDNKDLARLFEIPAATAPYNPASTHPYRRYELMTKIFNNITTRSNVFAVWLTVGFFEVTDENARPVKLGAEIGRAEGRHVRHRMFALIDRSNLAMPSQLTQLAAAVVVDPSVTPPISQTVAVNAISGTSTVGMPVSVSMSWTIQPGQRLLVDPGAATREEITVTAVDTAASPPTITAVFTKSHNPNVNVMIPGTQGPIANTVLGNPGPQSRFDPRRSTAVVLYFSIID